MKEAHNAEDPDPVADKGWSILSQDRSLSEEFFPVGKQKIEHFLFSLWPWNDLEELQVPGWVKKVGSTEMGLEICTPTFAHKANGDPRRV